jgi:hypothetical protein
VRPAACFCAVYLPVPCVRDPDFGVRATEGSTLDVFARSWRANIAPALTDDLRIVIDEYVRTVDGLVWVALQRCIPSEARNAMVSQRDIGIRSTVEALNADMGLNIALL